MDINDAAKHFSNLEKPSKTKEAFEGEYEQDLITMAEDRDEALNGKVASVAAQIISGGFTLKGIFDVVSSHDPKDIPYLAIPAFILSAVASQKFTKNIRRINNEFKEFMDNYTHGQSLGL